MDPTTFLAGIQSAVQTYFFNPLGLLALLALIPLLIFYLVKPKPEEQVIPSFMFFQEDKGDSKLRRAYRKILKNIFLLLQILTIVTFAFALADPIITDYKKSKKAVIVLDTSASMEQNSDKVEKFVKRNVAEKNVVMTVDENVEVLSEKASPSKVMSIVKSLEYTDSETDVVSALELAEDYDGKVVLASDMEQTLNQRNVRDQINSMDGRSIISMEAGVKNRWAFTGLDLEEKEATLEIFSYVSENISVEIQVNDKKRGIELSPGLNTINISPKEGRNKVSLPKDSLESDNTIYFVVPDSGSLKVSYIGKENPYFTKAINLIRRMNISALNRGSYSESDIYVINKPNLKNEENLEKQIEEGGVAVAMPNSELIGNLLSNSSKEIVEDEVKITKPVKTSVGTSSIIKRGIDRGKSYSVPEYAIKVYKYGDGKILAYNLKNSSFNKDFLYPIFWKKTLIKLSDRPTLEELNIETGSSVRREGMYLNSGFKQVKGRTYAVNMLSKKESTPSPEKSITNRKGEETQIKVKKSSQNYIAVALIILVTLEAFLLWRRGELF